MLDEQVWEWAVEGLQPLKGPAPEQTIESNENKNVEGVKEEDGDVLFMLIVSLLASGRIQQNISMGITPCVIYTLCIIDF